MALVREGSAQSATPESQVGRKAVNFAEAKRVFERLRAAGEPW